MIDVILSQGYSPQRLPFLLDSSSERKVHQTPSRDMPTHSLPVNLGLLTLPPRPTLGPTRRSSRVGAFLDRSSGLIGRGLGRWGDQILLPAVRRPRGEERGGKVRVGTRRRRPCAILRWGA